MVLCDFAPLFSNLLGLSAVRDRSVLVVEFEAIHDDFGTVYVERRPGLGITRWCAVSLKGFQFVGNEGTYPYTFEVWLTVPVSREKFELRFREAQEYHAEACRRAHRVQP